MGDEVYQPQDDEDVVADSGLLDSADTLDDRGVEPMEEGFSPPEKPLAVNQRGTTAAEQRRSETLDERLAREVPDAPGQQGDGVEDMADGAGEAWGEGAGGRDAGRLVAPDEGARSGSGPGLVGQDAGIDGGARTAEEAAVHIVDEDDVPGGDAAQL
ncbi:MULTISPECIES: DUF5709 domain-containing protein [unclassified Streptomyces]|uniref:DUF5709 domain-containing protein n=1 Tax=unclassified Streptomyces TaxID=2593676 RepID=UPI003D923CC6